MRNTITNEYGVILAKDNIPTIKMVRENNISIQDIAFIRKARYLKRKSTIRRKKIIDNIFSSIGVIGFFIMVSSVGAVEMSEVLNAECILKMILLIVSGLALMGICALRDRYTEYKKRIFKKNHKASNQIKIKRV